MAISTQVVTREERDVVEALTDEELRLAITTALSPAMQVAALQEWERRIGRVALDVALAAREWYRR
jgi:hypothetical protein